MELGPAKGTNVTNRNTEVGQRIGENWAVTSNLGKTRDHLNIHVASTGRCEDSLGELLERQQPGVLGGRVAFRDDMENSVNKPVETGHDWRDLRYVARRSKALEPNPMTSRRRAH